MEEGTDALLALDIIGGRVHEHRDAAHRLRLLRRATSVGAAAVPQISEMNSRRFITTPGLRIWHLMGLIRYFDRVKSPQLPLALTMFSWVKRVARLLIDALVAIAEQVDV